MTHKTQKIITTSLVALAVAGDFWALLYIVNLNQPMVYIQTAMVIWVLLAVFIFFIYDLHFKTPGSWGRAKARHESVPHRFKKFWKMVGSACWDRIEHLRSWQALNTWINYLLLPGMIYWATVVLFYVNFNFYRFQFIIFGLSTAALTVHHWYLKEIFYRKREVVDRDIFVRMTVVKIYASALVYAAALGIFLHFCNYLSVAFLVETIFCLTFLLVYQALFQHRLVNFKNIGWTTAISIVMAAIGYGVVVSWGYNYYTAAVFMTICYNLLWGLFHFHLDKALNKQALLEILILSAILAYMVLSITNFHARVLDGCFL